MKLLSLLALVLFTSIATPSLAQQAIKTHEKVEIGGISQWIGAESDDGTKPLLLFLHGGPGFSSRAYSKKFIRHLKKNFIVAQWDQRETGITAHWGPYSDFLTLDLFYSDTEEVVNYLLKKFTKKKLYLVGFSWGGFLGLNFANEHPELLHAYIHTSGMVSQNESEELTLQKLKDKAINLEKETQDEIAKIQIPIDSWQELYYLRKWTAKLLDNKKGTYPKALFESWSAKWMPLYSEASKVNYLARAPEISCPIYFFISDKDYVANYTLTEKYFDQLVADQKQIVWFHKSTHLIPSDEHKKFSEELIRIGEEFKK